MKKAMWHQYVFIDIDIDIDALLFACYLIDITLKIITNNIWRNIVSSK